VVEGPRSLSGTVVEAPDLRGGAALVTAGLVADGVTEVRAVHHIERGYEDLPGKLAALGADVTVTGSGERTASEARPSLSSCDDEAVRSA
jgi:UDP-N-acetylglucosamine 1-carboxyvinyltransferase